jgi:hypothetical protein
MHKDKKVGIEKVGERGIFWRGSHCGWARCTCAKLEFVASAPNRNLCTGRGWGSPAIVLGGVFWGTLLEAYFMTTSLDSRTPIDLWGSLLAPPVEMLLVSPHLVCYLHVEKKKAMC